MSDKNSNTKKIRNFAKLTRETFMKAAKPLVVVVDGMSFVSGPPKAYDSGSLGWNLTGKTVVNFEGEALQVQITGNAIIIGSKDLPGHGQ